MDVFEIIGATIGLVYLFLEYKANVWLWPVGIIMSLFYVIIFFKGGFYADAALNVYYIGANVYGLLCWLGTHKRGKTQAAEPLVITRTPRNVVKYVAAASLILWALFYFVLKYFTDSTIPLGDAFTTSLSIVATWMLAHKYLEQWALWIVVDIVSVALYFWKGLYPTAILYIVYVIVATLGLLEWRRIYLNGSSKNA